MALLKVHLLSLLLLLPFPQVFLQDFSTSDTFMYRILNWCIVGQGEHFLYQWPLSQLKPYLLKAYHKPRTYEENNFTVVIKEGQPAIDLKKTIPKPDLSKMKLQFQKLSCEASKDVIGDGAGNYLHRAHVKFTTDVPVQGLVIQGVHAPFGLGFPFGQFQNDEDFSCSEFDEHMVSRIIGCVSRPDLSLLHPTVGAFHHKLKNLDKDNAKVEAGPRKELHWNFKWTDSVCSSAKTVEFWALIILDFDYSIWIVQKFGPYDFTTPEKDYVKITGNYKKKVYQPHLPSLILKACNPPFPNIDAIIAKDPNNIWPRGCFKEYGIEYNASGCWYWKENKRQLYMAKLNTDPTEKAKYQSKVKCHTGSNYFPSDFDKSSVWSPIRFVGDFDTKCIQFYNRQSHAFDGKKTFRQPHHICKEWQARFQCSGESKELALNKPWPKAVNRKRPYFPFSKCEPCPVPPTTPKPAEEKPPGFIKRGVHGGLMSFSFFFFLPVSITICRFYKETLHTNDIHGWRIWLVLHVGLAALTTLFSYIAYTFPTFLDLDLHMYLGYAALFCCAGGLATGWYRHKNPAILTCSFYFHGISGYAGWGLAIASMARAPGIVNNKLAQYLCYFASGFSLAAMAILTIHVCQVDADMEMTPRRSHIPILEIRFDDIFVPGHRFRKIFLFVYIFVQFLICCGMLSL